MPAKGRGREREGERENHISYVLKERGGSGIHRVNVLIRVNGARKMTN